MTIEGDWNDLLTDAGAKRCPECGKHASIPALPSNRVETPAATADVLRFERATVWLCFECGHVEQQAS